MQRPAVEGGRGFADNASAIAVIHAGGAQFERAFGRQGAVLVIQRAAVQGQGAEAVQGAVEIGEGVSGGIQRHAAALHQAGLIIEFTVQVQRQRPGRHQVAGGVIQRTAVERQAFTGERDAVVIGKGAGGQRHLTEAGDAAFIAAAAVSQFACFDGKRVAALDQTALVIIDAVAAERQRLLCRQLARAVVEGARCNRAASTADHYALLVIEFSGVDSEIVTRAENAVGIVERRGIKVHRAAGFQRSAAVVQGVDPGGDRLLRTQQAVTVVHGIAGEVQRATAHHYAMLVIHISGGKRERAAAADAAGFTAVAVGQRRAVSVDSGIAGRLDQPRRVIQRAAVYAHIALCQQFAGLVIQRAVVELQGRAAGDHLSRRVVHARGVQRQRAGTFDPSLAVADCATADDVGLSRRGRDQATVVIQRPGLRPHSAAGRQRSVTVIQHGTGIDAEAAVLCGNELPALVSERTGTQRHVAICGDLSGVIVDVSRQIQREIAAAGLHDTPFLV